MTWITSVTVFSMLVLPRGGYYFNATGMMACEPFYPRASIRILAACGFYFPTTMILMYCYGSAFHVNKLRLRKSGCNTISGPDDYGGASMEKVSRKSNGKVYVLFIRSRDFPASASRIFKPEYQILNILSKKLINAFHSPYWFLTIDERLKNNLSFTSCFGPNKI